MEEKNPFADIKTYDNYTHLWQLTAFILFLQVVVSLFMALIDRRAGLNFNPFEAIIPALLVTAYISWVVLDGLGVSPRVAWTDWNANVRKDLVKAFKYFAGYAGVLCSMVVVLGAAWYFIGDGFEKMLQSVSDSSDRQESIVKTAAGNPLRLVALFFSACAVAPVAEELFFRRIIFASLRKKSCFWQSAIVSGSLFAIFHGGQAPVILPVGIYLCWVYERERRLPVNIMLHGMSNFVIILSQVYG